MRPTTALSPASAPVVNPDSTVGPVMSNSSELNSGLPNELCPAAIDGKN